MARHARSIVTGVVVLWGLLLAYFVWRAVHGTPWTRVWMMIGPLLGGLGLISGTISAAREVRAHNQRRQAR